ncbi:MAG: hypothetical protein WAT37_06710 [Saprospiraceae bacterium]
MAKITYHKSHSFVDVESGISYNFITQLYKVGIYGILNGDAGSQGNFTPQGIRKMEKALTKLQSEEKIKDLVLGVPITVSDVSGFWEEV